MNKVVALSIIVLIVLGTTAGTKKDKRNRERRNISTVDQETVITLVFTTNTGLTHLIASHNADITAALDADNVARGGGVIDLDTVDGFAHAVLDSTAPTVGYYNAARANELRAPASWIPDVSRVLDLRLATGPSTRAMGMIRIPVENYIPAYSSIVSADMKVDNGGTRYYSYSDTVVSILMTAPADSAWYRNKGVGVQENLAFTTWNQQRATSVGGQATTAADVKYWDPPISSRPYIWDMAEEGSIFTDWSGSTATQFISTGVGYSISFLNCVQAAVNGEVNNGFAFTGQEGGTVANGYGYWGWDHDTRDPVFVVKFIRKKYRLPYGSSDWAMTFSTDDFKKDANAAYTDTFNVYGGTYTMFLIEVAMRTGGVTGTVEEALDYLGEGHEIAMHSRTHPDNIGLRLYQPLTVTSPEMDDLLWEMEPEWLYVMSDSVSGDRNDSHPYFGKSLALPQNHWSPKIFHTAVNLQLSALRMGEANLRILGQSTYYVGPQQEAAKIDSMTVMPAWGMSDLSIAGGRRPRNMIGLPTTTTIQAIVGAKGATLTRPQILQNMTRLVHQKRGQQIGIISLFAHDFSSGPYDEGFDEEDAGAFCESVVALGGRFMNVSEMSSWRKQYATAVATPTGFNAAAGDTFLYTAEEAVWFVPDGIGNTFIRGVKGQ
jgi:hypothetical protein